MSITSSDGVLHFKRKQIFSKKFMTFPMEDGALLISHLDHHIATRIRAITKFNDFNAQDVFYGVSPNSGCDKLKLVQMKYVEPNMDIKHIHTIDDVARFVISDSCPFYIYRNDEGALSLLRFDENHKKVDGRKLELEFTNLKDFFVYKNFIYCLYLDPVTEASTLGRFDMEGGGVTFIAKTERTCCRNFLLDKHRERILMLSDRTLLLIDHASLRVDKIESDFPYRPFYRLVSITEDGELTISSRRGATELWTAGSLKQMGKTVEDEPSTSYGNYEDRIRELERKFAALERDNEYEKQKQAMANYINDID